MMIILDCPVAACYDRQAFVASLIAMTSRRSLSYGWQAACELALYPMLKKQYFELMLL